MELYRGNKKYISTGKRVFEKLKGLLSARRILILLRRIARRYIWGMMLCGCEAWTVKKEEEEYIDRFEMCCEE